MTPLRQRFADDLRLRNYSARTVSTYVGAVSRFALRFNRSPAQLGPEDIRRYQLHLLEQKASWSRFNQAVCALRFLYRTTLGSPGLVEAIPYGKKPRSLPCVLSPEEVVLLFDAAVGSRDRMLLQVAYACGLRVSEVCRLRAEDIDSARMQLLVRCSKGRKGRRVAMSNSRLLQVSDEEVTFSYKDYKQRGKERAMTLTGAEFARRFLQHILPLGFVRVRHYGLLGNRGREGKLRQCRQLLLGTGVKAAPAEATQTRPEERPRRCPVCGEGEMRVIEGLPPGQREDSS